MRPAAASVCFSKYRNRGTVAAFCCLILFFTCLPNGTAEEKASRAQQSLERRQRIELLGFFMKDPSEATMPQTPLAIELYNQGVQFYEQKEYDIALSAFRDSLRYNPKNALAHELMGDIHYFRQNLGEARDHYEAAFRIQPRAGLKTKLEKIDHEAVIEDGLSTYREEHFIIKYRGSEDRYDGFQLRELMRKTYRNISKDFGYYFSHKVVVLLYDQEEFRQLTRLPHWASGVYDGKIRMPAYKKGFSDKDLRALSAHEMTHAFVQVLSRGRAPVWINEGLAEYEENKVRKNELIVFNAAVKTGDLFTLDEMMTLGKATGLKDPLRVNLFYEQSFQLVRYLIDRYGMFRVKKLLEEFAKGSSSDEAVRNVLKISISRLEREWKETL